MKFAIRKKVLFALFLVFLAPGMLAILFYMHPDWLSGLPTNKGILIQPATQVSFLEQDSKDKWHLAVWCPRGCDETCLATLDKMARVRLALGRRLYQVDLWYLQGHAGKTCGKTSEVALTSGGVKSHILSTEEESRVPVLSNQAKVLLIDPNDYLVLEYPVDGKPEDVFQDLKRLLNTREQA
ncbi:MAG: hypothetical protein P1U32_00210 [Legionellaceae bacterium]|nr:hypothetical protein [Legionellaceae bacterium]